MPASAVSIVMPYRDAAGTLPAVLADISQQTLGAWELLAIDDGSEDEGPVIVADAAARDRRIRPLHVPRQGIVAALTVGCEAAEAPLVARMDADDAMDPRRLAVQAAHLEEHPHVGLVSCLVRFGGDPRRAVGFAHHVRWCNEQRTPEAIRLRRFVEMPIAHPSVLFRRELIERHGGYRQGPFPEDYELLLRWLEAGVVMDKVPDVLLTWNDPPDRLTRSDPRYAVQRHYDMKCAYLAMEVARQAAGRSLWLWGAGRITRRRFDGLARHGLALAGFIDIDPRKVGRCIDGRRVVRPDDVPPMESSYVIAGVGARGARELAAHALQAQGRLEGRDFILAG